MPTDNDNGPLPIRGDRQIRGTIIGFRVNADEAEIIKKAADREGLRVSDFLKMCVNAHLVNQSSPPAPQTTSRRRRRQRGADT